MCNAGYHMTTRTAVESAKSVGRDKIWYLSATVREVAGVEPDALIAPLASGKPAGTPA